MQVESESYNINKASILQVLEGSKQPLSAKEIRSSLKCEHKNNFPEYLVTRYLRKLLKEGTAHYSKGKWESTLKRQPNDVKNSHNKESRKVPPPDLSTLGVEILRAENTDLFNHYTRQNQSDESQESIDIDQGFSVSGPWAKFRRLISYYRDCIRSEEGAEASAYVDNFGSSYFYFAKSGEWYPKPGLNWSCTIPLGEHISEFVRNIEKSGEDVVIVLGYPLQGVYLSKEDEPDIALIRPIFQYQLKARYNNGALVFSTSETQPSVNLEWLRYAFQSPNQQKNFLAACGLLANTNSSDEFNGADVGHDTARLDQMVTGVSTFLSDKIKQPLQINTISSDPLNIPFETGIYNKSVIMIGKKARYTKTLINELTEIEQADDSTLDKTALRLVFKDRMGGESEQVVNEISHESCVIDTDLLNMEQRRAISALLNNDLAVITGPPGTGKSQVVSSAIMNLRLKERTCLFASRNHKAIDAVVHRCKDKDEQPLIIRTNSKEDPSLKYTFVKAIRDLLTENSDFRAKKNLESAHQLFKSLLEKRGEYSDIAYDLQKIRDQLGELEEKMALFEQNLSEEAITDIDAIPHAFPITLVKSVRSIAQKCNNENQNTTIINAAQNLLRYLILNPLLFFAWLKTTKFRDPKPNGFVLILSRLRREKYLEKLFTAANYAESRSVAISLEQQMKKLPTLERLSDHIEKLSEKIASGAKDALSLDLISRNGIASDRNIREDLVSLRVALNAIAKGIVTDEEVRKTKKILGQNIPLLLNHYPCWAVTNLSVGSRIPLFAGMYDLAIVDEASQSDIASAIPILFRAKRAAVVGDPHQLTHSSKLSVSKETLLRKSAGLSDFGELRYSYTDTSLYDLFAQTERVKPIFLSTTYRSIESIAQYSNDTFYDGKLRVATNPETLKIPGNLRAGIHWTDISGEVASAGGGGCYCIEEVNNLIEQIKVTIRVNRFRGSLGVVTPFRQQANRINDALYDSGITFQELERAQVHVDTSHGFQGDEKDVIFFSLCAGGDMPTGSRLFLRETGNLFNVAVSRARAVFHVFGNRNWAERCGIKHIQNLARPTVKSQSQTNKGKWYPHESPWEKILFEALVEKGLDPIPQYPVSGRRLDMALVDSSKSTVKIDIEVDGDRYHRNRDGSRKTDDVWRDIQLQGIGWLVMRFWVYELRENLTGCVEKIVETWRENDCRK